jgi:hypothetical protein
VTLEWVPRAMEKKIDLGFEGTGWPLQVSGNALLLRELIVNLVDNAVKYTPPEGRVTVRSRASEFAILEVEDDGPGIAEADRELVFERFYRVLGNEAPGSGLGLAIVREIADLHLGSVQLKPGPSGRGTLAQAVFPRRRFTVSALLAQAAGEVPADAVAARQQPVSPLITHSSRLTQASTIHSQNSRKKATKGRCLSMMIFGVTQRQTLITGPVMTRNRR